MSKKMELDGEQEENKSWNVLVCRLFCLGSALLFVSKLVSSSKNLDPTGLYFWQAVSW